MRKTSDILWQDAQHQVLFRILDDIRSPNSGGEILSRLRDYTENHFALEEHYMNELDYPGREEHVAAHNRFRMEIFQLLEDRASPDLESREIIATYLSEWLKRHVFGIDKKLEAIVQDSDLK